MREFEFISYTNVLLLSYFPLMLCILIRFILLLQIAKKRKKINAKIVSVQKRPKGTVFDRLFEAKVESVLDAFITEKTERNRPKEKQVIRIVYEYIENKKYASELTFIVRPGEFAKSKSLSKAKTSTKNSYIESICERGNLTLYIHDYFSSLHYIEDSFLEQLGLKIFSP